MMHGMIQGRVKKQTTCMALFLCLLLVLGSTCAFASDDFLVDDESAAAVSNEARPGVSDGEIATIMQDKALDDASSNMPDTAVQDLQKDIAYQAAVKLLTDGALLDAINSLAKFGKYRDAVAYTDYALALLNYRRNDLRTAAEGFSALEEFENAEYMKRLCVVMGVHRQLKNGKFGYVDLSGIEKIEPVYDWAERVFRNESRASVVVGDLLSEENGLLPVAVVFEGRVEVTSTDLVPKEGKYGLLRRDGKLIVPMRYDEVLWTRNGVAALRDGEQIVLFNLVTGEQLGQRYDQVLTISEGMIAVCVEKKWGYLNANGKLLGDGLVWDTALPFSEGMAGVSANQKAGFINQDGKTVIPLTYQAVQSFGEGLAGFREKKRWGFLNAKGEVVIKAQYADVKLFDQGSCAIKKGDKWGLIDVQGTLLLKCRYDEVTDFDPVYHRAWIRNNKLWGIINPKGMVVLEPTWTSWTDFGAEGISRVSYRGSYGYVDTMGVTRIPNNYEQAVPFSAGFGGVLNSSGQVEYLNKLLRGFSVDSNIPTEALCGFIEGRKVTVDVTTQTDADVNEQQTINHHIVYRLYALNGSPITTWGQ